MGHPDALLAGPRRARDLARGARRPAGARRRVAVGVGDAGRRPARRRRAGRRRRPAVLGVLLFLFRRRAPLVPFSSSAVLAACSPAVTRRRSLVTAYAVGRYVAAGRSGSPPAVAGSVAVTQPWTIGSRRRGVRRRWPASRSSSCCPVRVGAWVRTRADLLAALARARRAGRGRAGAAGPRGRAQRAHPDRPRDARRRRPPGEPHGAAGRRDRDGRRRPRPGRAARRAGADRRPAGARRAAPDGRRAARRRRTTDAPLGPQPGLDDLDAAGRGVRGRPGWTSSCTGRRGAAGRSRGRPGGLPDRAGGADQRGQARARRRGQRDRRAAGPASWWSGWSTAPGGPRRRTPAAGSGWWAWRERVRTLGGTLAPSPRLDGGFVVEAVLPA